MIMTGRLVKGNKTIKKAVVVMEDDSMSYRDALEQCLINVCRELDIAVPLWLRKNTVEFLAFRKTSFNSEHFIDRINFDKFEMEVT